MTVSRLRAIPIIFSLLLLTLSIGCRHRDELTERRLVGLRDSTRTFFMLKNYDTGMVYARRLEKLSDPELYPLLLEQNEVPEFRADVKRIFSIAVIETFGEPENEDDIISDDIVNESLLNPLCESFSIYEGR